MKKISTIIIAILAAAVLLAGCSKTASSSSNGSRFMKVGVRKNLPDFSSYSEEADTYYGFEDDLANALAARLGYDGVQFVGVDPEERESVLENGQADCIIAAYSYTEERAGKFDLSEPYYYDSGRVLVEKSTLFEDYADLKGSTVAVRNGTDAAENLAAKLAESGLIQSADKIDTFLKIVQYDSYDDMNIALEYGDVDAVCADGCISQPWLNDERMYLEEAYSEEKYVIAAAKGSDLTEKIEQALEAISADGTLERLETKWGILNEEE